MDVRVGGRRGDETMKILGEELSLLRQEDGRLVMKSPRAHTVGCTERSGEGLPGGAGAGREGHRERRALGASTGLNEMVGGLGRTEAKSSRCASPTSAT